MTIAFAIQSCLPRFPFFAFVTRYMQLSSSVIFSPPFNSLFNILAVMRSTIERTICHYIIFLDTLIWKTLYKRRSSTFDRSLTLLRDITSTAHYCSMFSESFIMFSCHVFVFNGSSSSYIRGKLIFNRNYFLDHSLLCCSDFNSISENVKWPARLYDKSKEKLESFFKTIT